MWADHLIRFLTTCGRLIEANMVFSKVPKPTQFTWNAIIDAQAKLGQLGMVLQLYGRMQEEETRPDKFTFFIVLKACTNKGSNELNRRIHQLIIESGLQSDVMVGSTLVAMYAKWGMLEEAEIVLDKLHNRNEVSWNALISGYAQNGEGLLALECLEIMQDEGLNPTKTTVLSALIACGSIGAIEQGRCIHQFIIHNCIQFDMMVGNTLVDMYAKCGNMTEAHKVFEMLPTPNLVSWNAMILGYAHTGHAELALCFFEEMQLCGTKPNDIAFLGILTALSRAGLVDDGLRYFFCMKEYHGIKPDIFHITCMADLLGRAGHLVDAENLLKDVKQSNICLWLSMLSACKMHGNVELGRYCFEKIVFLDSCCDAACMLMANIYASAHMREDVLKLEMLRKDAASHKGTFGEMENA